MGLKKGQWVLQTRLVTMCKSWLEREAGRLGILGLPIEATSRERVLLMVQMRVLEESLVFMFSKEAFFTVHAWEGIDNTQSLGVYLQGAQLPAHDHDTLERESNAREVAILSPLSVS